MHTLLYVSSLAPDALISDVAKIAQVARRRNAMADITGLLVFDGSGFVQLLEGERAALEALLARIERDPRHRDLDVLAFESFGEDRRFPHWRLGYHFAADEKDDLDRLRGLRGAEAFAEFTGLLHGVDADSGATIPG